jgi:CRISPR-associated endonuclease Csy4
MDHYLDITLLPDPEFTAPILMNALFAKLHRLLVRLDNTQVGISFPKTGARSLGNRLRLHGPQAALSHLMAQPWLNGMRDHIEVSDISPIPSHAKHCRVKRVQAKSSAERLRRRYQQRHPETDPDQLIKLIPDSVEEKLQLPYLRLKSLSSGQDFLLFIQQSEVQGSNSGSFNSYGLSSSATLSLF